MAMISKDAKPVLKDLQYMSCTSQDGRTITFKLMERIKPRVTRLAIALGFPQYIIANLKTEPDPVHYLFAEWLGGDSQEDTRPLTWGTLISALKEAGLVEEFTILQQHIAAKGAAVEARRRIHTDSSDPPLLVVSPAAAYTRVPGSVADKDPSWLLLISIKKPDGDEVRIKDAIVDFHDRDQCIQFAHALLKSRQNVMRIEKDDTKQKTKDFVRAVLDQWLSSGSSSWQQLVDSMRDAGMDKATIDDIAKYVLWSDSVQTATAAVEGGKRPQIPQIPQRINKERVETDFPETDTDLPQAAPKPSASKDNHDEDISFVSPRPKSGFNVQSFVKEKPNARGFAVIVTNGKYETSKYKPLDFTEEDGKAMEETLKNEFGFECYRVKDRKGDEIQDLVTQTSECDYPASYKYIAFVYSGHGDIVSTGDQERSGLVGIDGKLIMTTCEVVNPLKNIKRQSIVKMLFVDACRGNQNPLPMSKGRPTNCLVAHATQLGYKAFGNIAGPGSQWMFLLADKLKQRDKSVQEVLEEVKEKMLKDKCLQYPETDDSDCSQPIYLKSEPVQSKGATPLRRRRLDEKPSIGDLASFMRRDGAGFISIIDRILEAGDKVIKKLNNALLNAKERPAWREPASDGHNKIRFVIEIFTKWLSKDKPKVQQTWENLTECLEDAGLDEDVVQEIKDNLD